MPSSTTRRQWLFSALSGTLTAGTVAAVGGCGSILFPERVGQSRSGPIDWRVVALDGVGLVFFFVPGVVAFAIDFYNGTLFLPSHPPVAAAASGPAGNHLVQPDESRLEEIDLPPGPGRRQQVEQIVTARVGRPVLLDPGSYQTQPLSRIEEFWATVRRTAGIAKQPA